MLPFRITGLSLLIALIILLPTPVAACSVLPPTVYIACGNGVSIQLPTNYSWRPVADAVIEAEIQAASTELDKLSPQCGASKIASLKTIFEPYYRRWRKGEFESYLRIEEYSLQRETALVDLQNQFTNCRYQAFTRVGNWLFISDQHRDYCTPGLCFFIVISPTQFLVYIITHLNWRTVPYLGVYAIAAVSIVIAWILLLRQRISSIRKLNQMFLIWSILAIVAFISTFLGVSLSLEIIGWSLATLLVALIITSRQRSKVTADVQPDST